MALAATALGAAVAVRAHPATPQAAAPRPLVPLTAGTIARDLDTHLGENASMMAAVEAILSKTVFVVDQDRARSTGQDVVVIAPTLTAAPDINTYVTVQGEVIRFDPDEIAKRARGYTLDLSPDLVTKYRGRPAVLATAVITPVLVDLAKRPIPPMTADERAFQPFMQAINPAFTALRGGLAEPDAAQTKAHLATLKQAFTEVQAFFTKRGTDDAAKWAAESVGLIDAMNAAAEAGKWDEIKTSVGSVQQLCAACHNEHRERMDDGTFRIRNRQHP